MGRDREADAMRRLNSSINLQPNRLRARNGETVVDEHAWLPGNRCRNFTTTISARMPGRSFPAFAIRIRRSPRRLRPEERSPKGVAHQCRPDYRGSMNCGKTQRWSSFPGVIRRRQGVRKPAISFSRLTAHEGRQSGNCLARDAEVLPPRLDRVGRVNPNALSPLKAQARKGLLLRALALGRMVSILGLGLFMHEDHGEIRTIARHCRRENARTFSGRSVS